MGYRYTLGAGYTLGAHCKHFYLKFSNCAVSWICQIVLKKSQIDVKWRELDFTQLLNSALKFLTLRWHIMVFSRRIATEKIAIPRTAIVRGPNLRADCHRPELPAKCILGLREGVGNPQHDRELIAKQLFLLWPSAELEREV
jgi:hypothetical protein